MPSITDIFKIRKAALAVMAAGMLLSCSEETPGPVLMPDGTEAGYISLDLRSSKATRAETEPDEATLNENLINNALVCLYPAGDRDKAVVNYISGLNIRSTDDSNDYVKVLLDNETRLKLFPGDATTCGAYVVANISQSKADSVINNFTTLDAVKNMVVYDNYANRQTRTRFAMDGETTGISLNRNENNYSASGKIDLQRVASKITLAVKIENVTVNEGTDQEETWEPNTDYIVALINNGVCRSSFITMGENAYVPVKEDVAKKGDYFSTKNIGYLAGDDYGPRLLSKTTATENNEYPYVLQRPFYTMPNSWDDEDDYMTYITLRVPWSKDGGVSYQYCYYTVPVVRENSIGRNISYRINLNIKMLGSFVLEDPIVPDLEDLSYYAAEWGTATTDVDITSNRYLVLDQNEFTLNNDADIDIPFYSSHKVSVTDVKLTYYRYYMNAQGTETAVTIDNATRKASIYDSSGTPTDTICSVTVPEALSVSEDNKITFKHELVEWTPVNSAGNEVSLTYSSSNTDPEENLESIVRYVKPAELEKSYTRYKAVITIVHYDKVNESDEELFKEIITINQYPEIYIEATENYYNSSGSSTSEDGNIFVNGTRGYGLNGSHWYKTSGISTTASNACPNQYVITVTQLDQETDPNKQYIIGDPRSDEIDLMSNIEIRSRADADGSQTTTQTFRPINGTGSAPETDWATARDIDNPSKTRQLTYYYPTDDSSTKARWIAPKFRIASSYAVNSNNSTYNNDKLRCAAYQELKYPAGRWRMPTVAEVEYIMKLSQGGKIPVLFTEGTYYMTAQGRINTDDLKKDNNENYYGYLRTPTDKTGNASVRCVYDEWYWGDDVLGEDDKDDNGKYLFTWGDRQR